MATPPNDPSAYDPRELPEAQFMNLGVVVAEWNGAITEALHDGAIEVWRACGAMPNQIRRINVPGSMELTYGAKLLCKQESYDAVVVLGCVVQGETKHFDYVCQSIAQGVTELNLLYDTPVIFGVLTDNNIEQSQARAGGNKGNKGKEAAATALKMAGLRRVFR